MSDFPVWTSGGLTSANRLAEQQKIERDIAKIDAEFAMDDLMDQRRREERRARSIASMDRCDAELEAQSRGKHRRVHQRAADGLRYKTKLNGR